MLKKAKSESKSDLDQIISNSESIHILPKDFDIEEFEKFLERPRTMEEYYQEEGYFIYEFSINGIEYHFSLFELNKALVFLNEGEPNYKNIYVGCSVPGNEQNMIFFVEPIIENTQKAIEEANKLI